LRIRSLDTANVWKPQNSVPGQISEPLTENDILDFLTISCVRMWR